MCSFPLVGVGNGGELEISFKLFLFNRGDFYLKGTEPETGESFDVVSSHSLSLGGLGTLARHRRLAESERQIRLLEDAHDQLRSRFCSLSGTRAMGGVTASCHGQPRTPSMSSRIRLDSIQIGWTMESESRYWERTDSSVVYIHRSIGIVIKNVEAFM